MNNFESLHKVIQISDGSFDSEHNAKVKNYMENKVLYELGFEIAKRGLNNRCCFELQKNYVKGWHETEIHYDCYFHNISNIELVSDYYENMKWKKLSKSAWQEIWRRIKRLFKKVSP